MPLAKQPKVSKQTVCKIAFKLHINTEYMRSAPQYAIISNFFFSQIPLNVSVLLHFGSSLKCRSTYDLNYYPFFSSAPLSISHSCSPIQTLSRYAQYTYTPENWAQVNVDFVWHLIHPYIQKFCVFHFVLWLWTTHRSLCCFFFVLVFGVYRCFLLFSSYFEKLSQNNIELRQSRACSKKLVFRYHSSYWLVPIVSDVPFESIVCVCVGTILFSGLVPTLEQRLSKWMKLVGDVKFSHWNH